jgi:hypothetical protein
MAYDDKEESLYDNTAKKRPLYIEECDNTNKQQPKKKGNEPRGLSLKKDQRYKLWKKAKQEEKHWRKYGHTPRRSTKQKTIGNSQAWKTSFLTTDLRMNFGGYTARSSRFLNLPEIQSLDEAISLGFVVLKSSNW